MSLPPFLRPSIVLYKFSLLQPHVISPCIQTSWCVRAVDYELRPKFSTAVTGERGILTGRTSVNEVRSLARLLSTDGL